MSPTTRLLVGLIAGLIAGASLPRIDPQISKYAVQILEPIGILWVNAIRMTVLPMVVSLLVVSIGGAREAKSIGRLGRNAFLVCLAMLAGAAILVALIVPPFLASLPLSDASLAALRTNSVTGPPTAGAVVGLGTWITGLIPSNPVKAASDGALLQLVIFTIFFGIALTRVSDEHRAPVIAFFRGVADAMIVVVRWMLAVAPIGVFALAVPLAARAGVAAAGALAYYVVAIGVVCLILIALCAVLGVTLGRVPLRRYLKTGAPAQAVAFSSRSSLASLPALVEGAEELGLPKTVSAFFLPLAVATFRIGAVPAMLVGSMFLGRLYGIDIPAAQIIAILLTSILLSFSVPGIPGGSILIMAPILSSAGIPAAGVGILLALDTVPDMFRTMTNVSGDYAAAAVLSRFRGYNT
jgi:proton glutamate symport protein